MTADTCNGDGQRPQLLRQGFLADLVAQLNLFAFWLPDMCTPGSRSHRLWNSFAAQAHASGRLLTVLGYFPSQEVMCCPASCSASRPH